MKWQNIMKTQIFLLTAGLLLGRLAVQAAPITVTNNSFENITASASTPTSLGLTIAGTNTTAFGAWTATAGSSVIGLTPSSISAGTGISLGGPTPTAGTFDARLTVASGIGTSLSLFQSLSATFQPNANYNLTLDLDPGFNLALLGQASLQLQAGSTTVASLSGTNLLNLLVANNSFQTLDLNYITGGSAPSGNIGILFNLNSVAGVSGNVYLDNVNLDVAAVPEPSTFVLALTGSLLLFGFSKFRKQKITSPILK
jgi:hypothetical protein